MLHRGNAAEGSRPPSRVFTFVISVYEGRMPFFFFHLPLPPQFLSTRSRCMHCMWHMVHPVRCTVLLFSPHPPNTPPNTLGDPLSRARTFKHGFSSFSVWSARPRCEFSLPSLFGFGHIGHLYLLHSGGEGFSECLPPVQICVRSFSQRRHTFLCVTGLGGRKGARGAPRPLGPSFGGFRCRDTHHCFSPVRVCCFFFGFCCLGSREGSFLVVFYSFFSPLHSQ